MLCFWNSGMYMEILQMFDSWGLSLQKLSFSVEETCHCRSGKIECSTIYSDLHVNPSADECSSRDFDMTQATVLDSSPWCLVMIALNMNISSKVAQIRRKSRATKTISFTVDSRTIMIRARNVKRLAVIQTWIVPGEM